MHNITVTSLEFRNYLAFTLEMLLQTPTN